MSLTQKGHRHKVDRDRQKPDDALGHHAETHREPGNGQKHAAPSAFLDAQDRSRHRQYDGTLQAQQGRAADEERAGGEDEARHQPAGVTEPAATQEIRDDDRSQSAE